MNSISLSLRSTVFALTTMALATIGAAGCASSTDSPEDETGKAEEALTCTLSDRSCYHEYAGHPYGTKQACIHAGTILTGTAFSFICLAEQPSGHEYVYVWSTSCPRGWTWQQCRGY